MNKTDYKQAIDDCCDYLIKHGLTDIATNIHNRFYELTFCEDYTDGIETCRNYVKFELYDIDLSDKIFYYLWAIWVEKYLPIVHKKYYEDLTENG